MLAISLSKDEQYALLLSTLAGLSTAIGGAIAVSNTRGSSGAVVPQGTRLPT